MAQRHLDPLNAQDARLLRREDAHVHMAIGTVATFQGPPPDISLLRKHVLSRLSDVPRYRQRLAMPPQGIGVPRWVDDPTFNLEYHVLHAALPSPGDIFKLHRTVAQIFSQSLDRTKPLWELYIIEGLRSYEGTRERWALVSKTHLALVDGADGIDLLTVLFDPVRSGVTYLRRSTDRWQPRPLPTNAQLTAAALEDRARDAAELPRAALDVLRRPSSLAGRALDALSTAVTGRGSIPVGPLDQPIGPHRRYVTVPAELSDLRRIKHSLGATVNDVVLGSVAGGLRAWMHHRGLRVTGLELNAAVPVSIRVGTEHDGFASRLTQVVAPLPVDVEDPVARVKIIRDAMREVTVNAGALDADLIAGMADFAPPTILAQASRLGPPSGSFSLSVTNIPGPQTARYVLGKRLQSIAPIGYLAAGRPLTLSVMSYAGSVRFGVLSDYDAIPDILEITQGITDTLDALAAHAGGPRRPTRRRVAKPTAR